MFAHNMKDAGEDKSQKILFWWEGLYCWGGHVILNFEV